jgi:hypothetical protein
VKVWKNIRRGVKLCFKNLKLFSNTKCFAADRIKIKQNQGQVKRERERERERRDRSNLY